MQIADEHGWIQWVLAGFASAWLISFGWLVRMVSSVRRHSETNREKIVENSQAIAVNSALREETNKRYTELIAKLDAMAKEYRDTLSEMEKEYRKELGIIHSRINDILAVMGKN